MALRGQSLRLAHEPPRDRRGRFRAATEPPLGTPVDEFLAEVGISRRMLKAAPPFEPPEDIRNIEDMQLRLRHYVLHNLDPWIRGRLCSPGMVFSVLERTFAIDRLQYARQLSHAQAQAASQPRPPKVRADQWVAAYVPSRTATMNQSGGTGAPAGQGFSGSYVEKPLLPGQGLFNAESRQPRGAVPPNISPTESSSSSADSTVSPTFTSDFPTLRLSDSSPSAVSHQPLAITPDPHYIIATKYDPDYDVVAGLPKKTKDALCPADYWQGFGNDPQAAEENYYARNKVEFREAWQFAKVPCRVLEMFDSKDRKYYVARAAFDLLREQNEARMREACTVAEDETGATGPAAQPRATRVASCARPSETQWSSEQQSVGATPASPAVGTGPALSAPDQNHYRHDATTPRQSLDSEGSESSWRRGGCFFFVLNESASWW